MGESIIFHRISEHILDQSIRAKEILDLLLPAAETKDAQDKLSKLANDLAGLSAQVSVKGDQFVYLYQEKKPET
jgi:hypothetical protein